MTEQKKNLIAMILFCLIIAAICYFFLFVIRLPDVEYEDEEFQYYRVIENQAG